MRRCFYYCYYFAVSRLPEEEKKLGMRYWNSYKSKMLEKDQELNPTLVNKYCIWSRNEGGFPGWNSLFTQSAICSRELKWTFLSFTFPFSRFDEVCVG